MITMLGYAYEENIFIGTNTTLNKLNKKLKLCLFNYILIHYNLLNIPTRFVKIVPKSILGPH
jgi:hypothetical protein